MYNPKTRQYALEVQQPFASLILDGMKTIETRKYELPTELIGCEILLITQETEHSLPGTTTLEDTISKNQADVKVLGSVVFSECIRYLSGDQWEEDRELHWVPEGSFFDWTDGCERHGWRVSKVESFGEQGREVNEMKRVFRSIFEVVPGQ